MKEALKILEEEGLVALIGNKKTPVVRLLGYN